MKKFAFLSFVIAIAFACAEKINNPLSDKKAEEIINKSIQSSGGDNYESSTISFKFRDRIYVGTRNGGEFAMSREFEDSLGTIKDIYTNESFTRLINDQQVEVHDTMAFKYENSINSVFYFGMLPYKLNDAAVITKYLGEEVIKSKDYHKVMIRFEEENGGKDFDDVFVYWINQNTYYIDFLAYEYSTDGGGMRFRENYNERIIEGIRFVDANNMKPKVKGAVKIEDIAKAWEAGDLVQLSKIELEEIAVK